MNLPEGWVIITLLSVIVASAFIWGYYLSKLSDKIPGVSIAILLALFFYFGVSYQYQPHTWWIIPGFLTIALSFILTEFTAKGRRFKAKQLQDLEKDKGRYEIMMLAFFLESVLIASIFLVPFTVVSIFRGIGLIISDNLPSVIGNNRLIEILEQAVGVSDLAWVVLLLGGFFIAAAAAENISERIWKSELYSNDTRPIDGVMLGINLTIFPGIKSIITLGVILSLLILLVINELGDSLTTISTLGLTLWLLTVLGVFVILQAIFVGGLLGGYRSIARLSRLKTARQNLLELDKEVRTLDAAIVEIDELLAEIDSSLAEIETDETDSRLVAKALEGVAPEQRRELGARLAESRARLAESRASFAESRVRVAESRAALAERKTALAESKSAIEASMGEEN